MPSNSMHLKILLPFKVFAEERDVLRIVAESRSGSFGLLPNRLDCAAALVPGILIYETMDGGEVCLAVDEGVLVKAGREVLISVRDAIGNMDLGELHMVIEREFLSRHEEEKNARSALVKLESSFLRRFAALHHE
ncbi:F0F1 ATP synthase subunit epsilon [Pseudomonas defluvii]|uniref:F0F1 ATP synthase subunit epsilon n=1 Tax=Pseudomonas defluvii TaxID=1876757 RepID=UPI0008114AAA|nr:F0F1 ATP synthase subunit epsilon [Pseudomonas defluvii]